MFLNCWPVEMCQFTRIPMTCLKVSRMLVNFSLRKPDFNFLSSWEEYYRADSFRLIIRNQTEFCLVHNQKENCQCCHITFNSKVTKMKFYEECWWIFPPCWYVLLRTFVRLIFLWGFGSTHAQNLIYTIIIIYEFADNIKEREEQKSIHLCGSLSSFACMDVRLEFFFLVLGKKMFPREALKKNVCEKMCIYIQWRAVWYFEGIL